MSDPAEPFDAVLLGGNGFLGGALRRRLVASGRRVLVVGRSPGAMVGPGESYLAAEALEQALGRMRPGATDIIDLAYATVPSSSVQDPVADFTANLRNSIRHLDFARAASARRYLFVSSGGAVYGDSDRALVDEGAATRPRSPYGVTKLACEHYSLMYHQLHGVPSVIVRPSNVFGPGQQPFRGQGVVASAMGSALQGRPLAMFGAGEVVRDFLFVEDFVDAVLEVLAAADSGETFNIGAGEGHMIRDVVDRIAALAREDGLSLEIDPQPERPFDVRANILDCSLLRERCGWRPATSLDEGLAATWRHLLRLEHDRLAEAGPGLGPQ